MDILRLQLKEIGKQNEATVIYSRFYILRFPWNIKVCICSIKLLADLDSTKMCNDNYYIINMWYIYTMENSYTAVRSDETFNVSFNMDGAGEYVKVRHKKNKHRKILFMYDL